jgi:hypothetical protein
MGREVRRVPVDFNWPLRQRWTGFVNPYYKHNHECSECRGSGYSPQAEAFQQQWRGRTYFDIVAHGSRPYTPDEPCVREFAERNVRRDPVAACAFDGTEPKYKSITNRPPTHGYSGLTFEGGVQREAKRLSNLFNESWMYHLNQDDVDALCSKEYPDYPLTEFFKANGRWPTVEEMRRINIFSSLSNASYTCIRERCRREGIEPLCPHCKGDGRVWESPEYEKLYDEWEPTPPPEGPAYQIWETVSEGSPVSPPFLEPRDLAKWMVENDDSITADTTEDQWVTFIEKVGWAPSGIGTEGGGIQSGVKAIAEMEEQNDR